MSLPRWEEENLLSAVGPLIQMKPGVRRRVVVDAGVLRRTAYPG